MLHSGFWRTRTRRIGTPCVIGRRRGGSFYVVDVGGFHESKASFASLIAWTSCKNINKEYIEIYVSHSMERARTHTHTQREREIHGYDDYCEVDASLYFFFCPSFGECSNARTSSIGAIAKSVLGYTALPQVGWNTTLQQPAFCT